MNKCLKISFMLVNRSKKNVQEELQKEAKKLALEGVVQKIEAEHKIRLVACGSTEKVEKFLDLIHKKIADNQYQDFEIEPFFKECDYRGVFRVIE